MLRHLLIFSIIVFSNLTFAQVSKVLFLGDSLTEGYGVKKENAYPSVVEDQLNGKIKAINGGVSGSTTSSGLSRLKWQLKAKPQIVVIALGANDGLRGIPVKVSKENLDKIITFAKNKNIKVLLAGMYLPQNYGEEYRKSFMTMFKELANLHEVTFMPFLLEGVARVKELNIDDGIHPNEEGHRLMAKNLAPFLEKLL